MARDFDVLPRSDDEIHVSAMNLRNFLGITTRFQFDLPSLIKQKLVGQKLRGIGTLELVIHEYYPAKASVSFKHDSCVLVVEEDTWIFAGQGDSESIFRLAHELGHLMLHNKHEQRFSKPREYKLNYINEDRSAEAQANKFAAYFLAPRQYIYCCETPHDLSQAFNFPTAFAAFRFGLHNRDRDKRPKTRCKNCSTEFSIYDSSDSQCPFCCS
ncbi:ImmA/IrrE family metallo-endopeptidase [Rhodoblastus sp.]|uniref:ImmA/IrrE family metallo-endopeptidase n=1 Tax=Rhodoblastus sp. TaxID=1962975 RepID=UPI00260B71E0|nr:ImmA/IrrE family metallo-endopeptidase [Rhodoblastus sp.]